MSENETPADPLLAEMKAVFGDDERRIGHALKVLDYAETILRSEPGSSRLAEPNGPRDVSVRGEQTPARPGPAEGRASPRIVCAAAILHDIGIHEAERKHGSSAGRFQEIEGPPIAREILERLGLDAADVEHVCRIVGSHHSAGDIDTPEFRVIWDADWLVNLAGPASEMDADALANKIRKIFRTAAGRALAFELFVPDADGEKGSQSA